MISAKKSSKRTHTRPVDWALLATELRSLPEAQAVNFALREIGTARGADRAWVIRYNREVTHFWNTHEWARPGIETFVHEFQGVPVTFGKWVHDRLLRGETLSLADVHVVDDEAPDLRRAFRRQSIRSILFVPIFDDSRLAIQIGFDAVRRPIAWTDLDARIVRAAGELIALRLFAPTGKTAEVFPASDPSEPRIVLRDGSTIYTVAESELLWIEADDDFTRVHLQGRPAVMELKTLGAWEKQLPAERFLRAHRGAVVNLSKIESLDRAGGNWRLRLTGFGDPIPVGRHYRAPLRAWLAA